MKTTIQEILEKELVGKKIVITTFTPVYEIYTIEVKKSASVTDKQFESGDKKYRMTSTRKRKIDEGKKVEHLEIKGIEDIYSQDYGGDPFVQLDLGDGIYHDALLTDDLEILD